MKPDCLVSAEHHAEPQRHRPLAMYAHEMPEDLVGELAIPLLPSDAAGFDVEAGDADSNTGVPSGTECNGRDGRNAVGDAPGEDGEDGGDCGGTTEKDPD